MTRPARSRGRRLLRISALVAAVAVALGLAAVGGVYLRLGARGAPLVSADPAVPLAERECPDGFRGARCGVVTAPLDHADPDGPTIEVGFVLFPAVNPGAGLGSDGARVAQVIGGGPGTPVTASAGAASIWPIRLAVRGHGLLAVDPRGTGWSTPLRCDALEPRGDGPVSRLTADPGAVARCAEQIGPQRVHYSTADTARDFELVRRALGVAQLDLLAFSYGAGLGAVYAGMFPDAVRTLTLDGAAPVAGAADLQPSYHAAMQRVWRDACTRSGACDADDALAALADVTGRLRDEPRPLDGSTVLDASVLAALAVATPELTDADGEPTFRLPVLGAVLAARDGDWTALDALARERLGGSSGAAEPFDTGASEALRVSVDCPESRVPWDWSADRAGREAQLAAAVDRAPAGAVSPFTPAEWAGRPDVLNYYSECIGWPAPPTGRPTERREAFVDWRPGLPVLVLNGDLDLSTPLEDARDAAAQFAGRTDAVQLARFRHHEHVVLPQSTCAVRLWAELLDDGAVEDPDRCLDADPKSVATR